MAGAAASAVRVARRSAAIGTQPGSDLRLHRRDPSGLLPPVAVPAHVMAHLQRSPQDHAPPPRIRLDQLLYPLAERAPGPPNGLRRSL